MSSLHSILLFVNQQFTNELNINLFSQSIASIHTCCGESPRQLSRLRCDLGGRGGGGCPNGGIWLGDAGGGIIEAAPGLPANEDEEARQARAPLIAPIVPELKPKCVDDEPPYEEDCWWCVGKCPGEPSCGLLPGEPRDRLDMLNAGPGEPGEGAFMPMKRGIDFFHIV